MTSRSARLLLALCAVAAASAAILAAGRNEVPAETSAGRFAGTWYRIEPGMKQVVQFRRGAGDAWEIRFIWETRDEFRIDTGWKPRLDFTFRGRAGSFELAFRSAPSSATRLVFHNRRDQEGMHGNHLVEEGDVALFRSGDGRILVWLQDPLATTIAVPDPIAPYEADGQRQEQQRLWVFMKAAHRLIEWDEIPW
jgi:hypothetical protein